MAESAGEIESASGLAITAHRSVDEVSEADVVIVPSMEFGREGEWTPGRYPKLVHWLREMYEGGATICSACTGANLTAEAGLLDGNEATVHWASENSFRRRHPEVLLRPDEVLVISGDGGRLITSGAATAWHDLALYLIAAPRRARHRAGGRAVPALGVAPRRPGGVPGLRPADRPRRRGRPRRAARDRRELRRRRAGRGDGALVGAGAADVQAALQGGHGHTPIAYVQRIRVERAKRLLETSDEPIEEISWAVGYEDPASFRRLFKRLTGLTPGAYRQRFQVPVLPTSS